jgi:hypothetical protein
MHARKIRRRRQVDHGVRDSMTGRRPALLRPSCKGQVRIEKTDSERTAPLERICFVRTVLCATLGHIHGEILLTGRKIVFRSSGSSSEQCVGREVDGLRLTEDPAQALTSHIGLDVSGEPWEFAIPDKSLEELRSDLAPCYGRWELNDGNKALQPTLKAWPALISIDGHAGDSRPSSDPWNGR